MTANAFSNRIAKNLKRLRPWLTRHSVTCFRAYDRDLPDVPVAIDVYGTDDDSTHLCMHVFEPRHGIERARVDAWAAHAAESVGVPAAKVHVKRRAPGDSYERQGTGGARHVVREAGLRFAVNLDDYLDTGLFLDHRNTRLRVREESAGRRMLNLFSYTGAFSVHAAAGGARQTVSVDLSPTYCRWAEENLVLNGFNPSAHEVHNDDVMEWVMRAPAAVRAARTDLARTHSVRAPSTEPSGAFDLAVIDPPTISRSKRAAPFDVQRDHVRLIARVIELLMPGGIVYFSTNFQGFSLGDLGARVVDEITSDTVPFDFPRRPAIHRAWRLVK